MSKVCDETSSDLDQICRVGAVHPHCYLTIDAVRQPFGQTAEQVFRFDQYARDLVGPKAVIANRNFTNIFKTVVERVPTAHLHKAWPITKAIFDGCDHFGFDPLSVVALIDVETHFDPTKRGTSGELGLMQIHPNTSREVLERSNLTEEELFEIRTNIWAGLAYLAKLRDSFKKPQLFYAAYNMGPYRLRENLENGVFPNIYYENIMKRYLMLNRLSVVLARNDVVQPR